MASTLTAVFQGAEDKAPFLIVPRISTKDYEKVKLTRTVGNEKRQIEVPKLTIADAELAYHVCLAFNRASRPLGLTENLNTPHLMFEEFSKCLSLDYQEKLDELREQEFVKQTMIKIRWMDFVQRNDDSAWRSLVTRRWQIKKST